MPTDLLTRSPRSGPEPKGRPPAGGRRRRRRSRLHPARRSDDSGWVLLTAIVAMLCTIGLMMVLSASSVEALRSYGGAWVFFQRQLMWVAIGAVVLAGAAWFDYHHWRKAVIPLLGVSVVGLVLVLLPGVGITAGGSSRWLGAGLLPGPALGAGQAGGAALRRRPSRPPGRAGGRLALRHAPAPRHQRAGGRRWCSSSRTWAPPC